MRTVCRPKPRHDPHVLRYVEYLTAVLVLIWFIFAAYVSLVLAHVLIGEPVATSPKHALAFASHSGRGPG
jgi:hypothetical protein